MKRLIIGLAFLALSSSAFAWDNRYEIKTDPYGSSTGGSTEIEMRKKYDYDTQQINIVEKSTVTARYV